MLNVREKNGQWNDEKGHPLATNQTRNLRFTRVIMKCSEF